MFGGQSLTEVFDQLSDYYGVQINYFPSDVANRYFTGKFSKNDSLEDILNDIALLHGFTLKKIEGTYVFRKKD
jgi:ferric-dicitrate binding protein FerR (iron transport regulator)